MEEEINTMVEVKVVSMVTFEDEVEVKLIVLTAGKKTT